MLRMNDHARHLFLKVPSQLWLVQDSEVAHCGDELDFCKEVNALVDRNIVNKITIGILWERQVILKEELSKFLL